ncbi:hypothetical protein NBE99_06395 [Thermosynechococcus sp. HN-54]|uniref:ribbon-helix-helix domain-containing protein n=1 Tax=Thermosynechococcus sp. HN-54 TaxID=2933959 RepID=UPI00202CC524|nr:ribbon-helix-helix domain-containing protein [Thermosynechococcus sp. HN-54]URR36758.1 hypothetical protein NBE99_06395 [Thermosynechococcus sp. HN-54]
MEDKQKVTLYLSPDVHRQLKIAAVVEQETMSVLAERAIEFLLAHPEVLAEYAEQKHGNVHRVYHCPECASALVLRGDELTALVNQPTVIDDDSLSVPSLSVELVSAR